MRRLIGPARGVVSTPTTQVPPPHTQSTVFLHFGYLTEFKELCYKVRSLVVKVFNYTTYTDCDYISGIPRRTISICF
jgi:hypothetical protein